MPSSPLVLITGSAGNVGRTVTATLRQTHSVRTFDLIATPGDPDGHVGDLADRAAVGRAMVGVHTVIHLGGCPHMHAKFMEDLIKPNVEGLWNMLEAAQECGVKRFIFASSCNVAFAAVELPQLTTDAVHVLNPYGATKAFGEVLGRWFYDSTGIEFLAVRIGYFRDRVTDPGLREGWLRRIWLGQKDCGRFFRLAIEAPKFGYGIVYACSRCPENYLDLTSAKTLIGYEPEEDVPPPPPA